MEASAGTGTGNANLQGGGRGNYRQKQQQNQLTPRLAAKDQPNNNNSNDSNSNSNNCNNNNNQTSARKDEQKFSLLYLQLFICEQVRAEEHCPTPVRCSFLPKPAEHEQQQKQNRGTISPLPTADRLSVISMHFFNFEANTQQNEMVPLIEA